MRGLCFKQVPGRGRIYSRAASVESKPHCLPVCLSVSACREGSLHRRCPHFSFLHYESDQRQEPVFLAGGPLLLHSQRLLKCSLWARLAPVRPLTQIHHSFLPHVFFLFPNPKCLSLLAPLRSALAASIKPALGCPPSSSPSLRVPLEGWTGRRLPSS